MTTNESTTVTELDRRDVVPQGAARKTCRIASIATALILVCLVAALATAWPLLRELPRITLRRTLPWETTPPHTLSIVDVGTPAHRYNGYYGLEGGCGAVGLATSDDLQHWSKRPSPLFTNGRWPSVVLRQGEFYMMYTRDYCRDSHIKLATSADGITFANETTIVRGEPRIRNQNPDLFQDPQNGEYFLYWYRGDDHTFWEIRVRHASTIEGLANASDEKIVLRSDRVLAAPNVAYVNGKYFLTTEEKDSRGRWETDMYSSAHPDGGFARTPGNPVLTHNSACLNQYSTGTTMHWYYCRLWLHRFWTVDSRHFPLVQSVYASQ